MLSRINYVPVALRLFPKMWSVRVLSVFPGTKDFTVALVHPVSYRSCTNQENLGKKKFLHLRMIILKDP